jgi:nitroimidazol reductase NimA-like FMN-containing flavoprotein (pyridoxamine 5'-phosphate oxidase superfamily)
LAKVNSKKEKDQQYRSQVITGKKEKTRSGQVTLHALDLDLLYNF